MIRDLAAEVFSDTFDKLEIVKSSRLLAAPKSERMVLTVSKALSITPIADCAPDWVPILTEDKDVPNDPSPSVFDSLKPKRDASKPSFNSIEMGFPFSLVNFKPARPVTVSYTHLTLPTILLV